MCVPKYMFVSRTAVTDRQTDRQTDRHKQTDRQTGRQADVDSQRDVTIIIIIAFKGAIRDYFSFLRRELSPTRTLKRPGRNRVQITCNSSSAYHVQHVVLRATWYEGTAQLLRQNLNRVYFSFI